MFLIHVVYFFLWTLMLYWIHRLIHSCRNLKYFHLDHHRFINQNGLQKTKWEFNNLLLYNDSKQSTIDLWITEVIPTLFFSFVTGAWWIFIFYYIWAAFLQENLEHNKNFNINLLSPGKWHLLHHRNYKVNFGLFFPIWDIIFKTYQKV